MGNSQLISFFELRRKKKEWKNSGGKEKSKFSPFSPRGQKKETNKRIIRVKMKKMEKELIKMLVLPLLQTSLYKKKIQSSWRGESVASSCRKYSTILLFWFIFFFFSGEFQQLKSCLSCPIKYRRIGNYSNIVCQYKNKKLRVETIPIVTNSLFMFYLNKFVIRLGAGARFVLCMRDNIWHNRSSFSKMSGQKNKIITF